jgi:hypothetical protein
MKVSLASRIKNINYSLEYAKAIMAKLIWNINASHFFNQKTRILHQYLCTRLNIYIRIVSYTIKNKIIFLVLVSDTARIGGDI